MGVRATLAVLPWASWAAIIAAAWLDPDHDVASHYISWLVDGRWAWLAAAGTVGLLASTLLVTRRLRTALPAGPQRDAAVTFLACAIVAGALTMVFPSRGAGEPLWRTSLHVALAVGAYTGILGAAAVLAWQARRGAAPTHLRRWLVVLVAALALLLVASAVVRLDFWKVDLRGAAQLLLAAAAAAWLSAAGAAPLPDQSG